MQQHNNLILLGVISGAHGIKGHVLVKSFTQVKKDILKFDLLDSKGILLNLKLVSQNKADTLICRTEFSTNRNEAEALKGTKLYCLKQKLKETENEEYYIANLINISVINTAKQPIGKVVNVFNFGAGDIIEVKLDLAQDTILVSFTKDNFPEVTKDYIILANVVPY